MSQLKNIRMFGMAVLILTLITAVILGLMAGPSSPITWTLVAVLVGLPFLYKQFATTRYVEWKAEYSVGLDSLAHPHKKLLDLINQLQTAVDYSTNSEFEREALDQLVDYTKTHFTYEEGLMEDNDYPDFEPHKAQHKDMIDEVEKVLAEYDKNPDTAMQNAIDYLKQWLINHINGTDKQYSSFLVEKGVK